MRSALLGLQDADPNGASLAWLALVVTLVAVFFGPLIQLAIAKRQLVQSAQAASDQVQVHLQTATIAFRGSVVSTNRQAWIDGLRQHVALFLAQTDYVWMRWSDKLHQGEGIELEEMAKEMRELTRIENQIILMLNPTEDDHAEIRVGMDRMHALLTTKEILKGPAAMESAGGELRAIVPKVLKREWERVKRGE